MAESNLHPDPDAQKRRSTRIVQAVPLTVTGVDALGRPFQERTSTLIINCHGARYQSKHYVLKNMWVTLEVPHHEPGQTARTVRARVTWIQRPRTVRELFQIGVELEAAGNVWGIAFPPSDWFPYPESGVAPKLEIPAPAEIRPPAAKPEPEEEWGAEEISTQEISAAAAERPEEEPAEQRAEDNVRVLPMPVTGDASLQLARQVARLVAEAKQQIQTTARESATHAVAAETRPLLAALQTQLTDAAEKSVAAAVAAHMEKSRQQTLQILEKEQEKGMAATLERLSGELDRRLQDARQQIDAQLSEVERTGRANFEAQIREQLQDAIQKLESLNSSVGSNREEVRAAIEQLRETSAKAASDEIHRWQEQMDQRTADAQARLAQMDQMARRLGEQIAAATTLGEVGWRGLLESDLETAHLKWKERLDASILDASRQASEQIARQSHEAARQIEQQMQQRIDSLNQSHSQIAAQAENVMGNLRSAIQQETSKGDAAVSHFQESVGKFEARRGEFVARLQADSEELTRRIEAVLASQTAEMDRRAESAMSGMAERLQPMLESTGHDTINKLAAELEQRLAPQIDRSSEILGQLSFNRDQAEKAVAEHQQRVWQVSDRALQETAGRGKEILAEIEKDFSESARAASGRWLAEIETRATETSHSTFESLFKSADWYEKKIQSQMQTTLEKGLEQAAARLREKAAEMSGLFASELDHYSRSYVEHAQGQMQENAREAAEEGGRKIAEAGDAAAGQFAERAAQLGNEQFDAYAGKTKMAFDQHATHMETHTAQIRANLESDARAFAAEFQRVLAQHGQQTLALGKQELGIQIDQAKDALLMESQALERQFQASLNSLGTSAIDEHKQRLENASNSWLLTTVSKLNQQSAGVIDELADTTEKRLKAVCNNVFAEMGEALRQRLAGVTAAFSIPVAAPPPVKPPEEQK
ncbi:MAG TPA: hypothetical protein VKT71_12195 [Candidatus Acidoferrales bacterium]|nr:hypothetical protein [Candidatus Acidoferrales bacterium]